MMSRWTTNSGVRFYSLYGLTIEVRWEGKWLEDEIEQFFLPFPFIKLNSAANAVHIKLKLASTDVPPKIPDSAPEPFTCYDVSIYETEDSVYVRDGLAVFQIHPKAGTGFLNLHYSFKDKVLLSKSNFFLIGLMYLIAPRGFYDLHAAGLINNSGVGYLLLGESGTGKSSLALSLVRQGWRFASDDALLLRVSADGVEAMAFRKHFYLDQTLIHHYPELAPYFEVLNKSESTKRFLDLESVYPNRYCPSIFPKVLICTSIVPQDETRLMPIDQTAALISLMRQSASLFFKRQDAKVHLDLLNQLVYQTETYQLLAGKDLYEEPDKISLLIPCK